MAQKRIYSLILALMFLFALVLTACGESTDVSTDPNATVSNTDIYKDANGKYVGATSGKRYDGETVTFLTASALDSYESEIVYNTYKEEGLDKTYPESLNEDLKNRQNLIEEKLGITIEEIKIPTSGGPGKKMCETIRKGAMSGTTDYDIVVPCLYDGATLAMEDLLIDLNTLSGLQLQAPWWNQSFNTDMTQGGQLYFTIGEIGITNKTHTSALYFNLDLWNKMNLSADFGGNPYELVRQGKWTVDVAFEAARKVSTDTNQDGKIDYTDVYGWGGNRDDMWSVFFASGEKIAKPGADGYPYISMFTERSSRLMEKLQEFVKDTEHYIAADDYFNVTAWPDKLVEEGFTEGRVLFHNAGMGSIITIGGAMAEHFGIVPVPKADTNQDDYYSLVNPWSATCFAIPSSVDATRLPMIVDFLNVMGAESMNTTSVSYQEILDYMKTRDDDSKDMLNNYILPSRACDVGLVYKWGQDSSTYYYGLGTILHQMATEPVGTFASKFESRKSAAESQLRQDMEFFRKKASEKTK